MSAANEVDGKAMECQKGNNYITARIKNSTIVKKA